MIALPSKPVRQLRVLVCPPSLDPDQGGIALVNRNVVRALQTMSGNGLEIQVRALCHHGGAPKLAAGYLPHPQLFQGQGCHSSRRKFLAQYAWQCLSWRPHLVVVGHLHLSVVAYLCRWLTSAKYALFCHGVEFDEGMSKLRQAAFRGAAVRLGISRFTANRLNERFADVVVEPCELAVDDVTLPPAGEEVNALPDAFGVSKALGKHLVLIVGRLASGERYKGHDQLITIMPSVVGRVPSAQLVVAGSGDDLERLKERARQSGVGQAILFPGFVSAGALATLFERCQLFAMPSRGEGFGLVYVEAMRFAKPCIASPVDAGGEVVVDGQTGYLIDPSDLNGLRQAIIRLLTDPELADRLGRAGLERLQSYYCFEHFRFRFQNLLARVLPELAEQRPEAVSNEVLVRVDR
jgi:glycosyltransferase involved in cell wall biosynthesis